MDSIVTNLLNKNENIFNRQLDQCLDLFAEETPLVQIKFEDWVNSIQKQYLSYTDKGKKEIIDFEYIQAANFIHYFLAVFEDDKGIYSSLENGDPPLFKYNSENPDMANLKSAMNFLSPEMGKFIEDGEHLRDIYISDPDGITKILLRDPKKVERIKSIRKGILSKYALALGISLLNTSDKSIQQNKPDYINEMIKQGRLFPDGVRIVKSLEDMLDYLITVMEPPTAKFIKDTFKKSNGAEYSLFSIKDALANSKVIK